MVALRYGSSLTDCIVMYVSSSDVPRISETRLGFWMILFVIPNTVVAVVSLPATTRVENVDSISAKLVLCRSIFNSMTDVMKP